MANYTRERSKYGAYVGAIQIFTSPGLGQDPTSAIFQDKLPAGFLRCNGAILEAKDYLSLSQILGVGEASRFGKEDALLRNANPSTGDLGSFQLPDLGSKVIVPSRGSGDYINDQVEATGDNRVGPEIEVVSNVGPRINVDYIGNFRGISQNLIRLNSNPSYTVPRTTAATPLDIRNFEGHAHNSNATYLNYSDRHLAGEAPGAVGSGKDRGQLTGNSSAGMYTDISNTNAVTDTAHTHRISRPPFYTQNFAYSFPSFDIRADQVTSYVDVNLSRDTKLDVAVAPFILVEYIIKY